MFDHPHSKRLPLAIAGAAATAVLLGACGEPPPPMPPMITSAASAPERNVGDQEVTEHVRTAIQQRDALKALDIQVLTLKGDVRLMGTVDSQAQIDEAVAIARASDGAHSVHDELTIKK